MRVMFDVDGVLADFCLGFSSLGNARFGTPISNTRSQQSWDAIGAMTPAQHAILWGWVEQHPEWWAQLFPLVDKQERDAIYQLATSVRYEVYFVTNRGIGKQRGAKYYTEEWLRKTFGIPYPTVVLSGAKGEVAKALSVHYAIDDKAGNAVYTQYHSPVTKSHLLDRPYNRFDGEILGTKVTRVPSVSAFLNIIAEAGGGF